MTGKRKKIMLRISLLAVILAGLAGTVRVWRRPADSRVQIVQDGTVLYTLDLNTAVNQTMEVEYQGRTNTIQIENGRIRVREAECPDQTCVHMGWLSSAAPIVCLPNRLVIEYVPDQELDAVVR